MRLIAPLAATIVLLTAAPASADTFTVTGTGDAVGATCSGTTCPTIRAALAAAADTELFPGPDTILVPDGDHQLDQGSGPADLIVDSPVTIRGEGARVTRVFGSGIGRVFAVASVTATISRLTMSGGEHSIGGDLYNLSGTVTLDHVRVTDGAATEGGGIANESGTMTIQSSLIDANNVATSNGGGDGGGILNVGGNGQAVLRVRDSTITGNTSQSRGGGISASSSGQPSVTSLERVTVARNTTLFDTSTPAGLAYDGASGSSFTVRGSIIDDNITLPSTAESNCGAPQPTSLGANVIGTRDCLFAGANDLQAANALLSAGLVNAGGQTDVLTIPVNSPAINRVAGCTGFDQRDATRPQGAGCDSGAFEFNVAPNTSLTTSPGPPRDAPTFTFASSEAGSTFQCRLDGPAGPGSFAPCVSPQTFSGLAPGLYRFFVRAVDSSGTPDPTPSSAAFTVASPPQPNANRSVVVDELSGTVRVKVPGGGYVPLDTLTEIPDGSTVDTRKGVVKLSFEPRNGGTVQTANFYDGIFKVDQKRRILELKLVEKLARCKSGQANAAAKKKRRLWGNGKGRFRTSGRYSSATVRGTKWLTQDTCAGTLTRVVRGRVAVRDRVRKKTIIVRKGKKYLARPKP